MAKQCDCKQCKALLDECGEHFPIYSKKLLIRGWAGVMSPVERAYYRKHRSEAQQKQAAALSARAKATGFGAQTRSTDAETGDSGVLIPATPLTPVNGAKREEA